MSNPANPGNNQSADAPLWQDPLPALFVMLWSTGFIGSKLGAPYSEPFTFLGIRFTLAAILMVGIGLYFRVSWPNTPARIFHAAIVGCLIHGVYLGGVFWAIDNGLPAGVAALIVALQPLVAGLAAGPILDERVTPRHWLGLGLGFTGVAMVVSQNTDVGLALGLSTGTTALACAVGMLALAAGTLYQKRFCQGENLRGHQGIQLSAAAILVWLLSFGFESQEIIWSAEFIVALTWLTAVMSIGTFTLLYFLIQRGKASQVSSLFYLVPPVTAIFAYFLFGETLGLLAIAGMGLTVVGVALATRQQKSS